ncbi:MAG TPA: ORF6N domain-containing protein [Chthoniobacterales bacterium]
MPSKKLALPDQGIDDLIREIRGQKVILDSDLAALYGVETKALNRAVKRNRDRFPKDFVFQLTRQESEALRYRFGTLKTGRGEHRKYLPWVFTEHGAIMAANVLNSRRAVQMSVFVVRAFLKMRALLGDKHDLARELASLEKELKKRLDVHETAIVTILQRVMDIIDPPAAPPTLRASAGEENRLHWKTRRLPDKTAVYPLHVYP